MKFSWQQDTVRSWHEFENGCLLMHCGTRVVIYRISDVHVYNVFEYNTDVISTNQNEPVNEHQHLGSCSAANFHP